MALKRCEWCEHEVPDSNFCIRCGHELGAATDRSMSRAGAFSGIGRTVSGVLRLPERPASLSGVRRAFAANPDESVLRPSIVSTIFPQLPKPSMMAFRVSLALGVVTVLLLGVLKLYPVGLIAAAVLLPALAVLYFYDVSVYEDTPGLVVGATMVWGIVAGVGTALLAKAISGSDVFVESSGSDLLLTRGVLIPALSAVLILLGPLFLMRYPRFNDVLDGATFGAGTAVAFTGVLVIVQAFSALDDGLKPPGELVPWLVKLGTIAVALPVLTMAVMGAAAGALWLRYRAPIRDRSALGRLGRPLIAVPVAMVAMVLAAIVQLVLPIGLALILIGLMAVIALLWLRQVVHVGLLEEALEIEDAPAIVCANCGHHTRVGGFCEYCGISQAALPRSRSGSRAVLAPPAGSET
jgi:hypothetical protein